MKQKKILFTYGDLKDEYSNKNSFNVFIFRLMKKGKVKLVKRGLYALVDPSTENIYASKFQIGCALASDAYFSYHEALEYYGLANQSFVSSFTYISKTFYHDVDFEEVTYSCKKSNDDSFVLDKMKEEGIRVVTLERAIVDSIDNITLAGGLEEIEYALDDTPKLNFEDIKHILKKKDKAILYIKVGYLFEKHLGKNVPSSFLKLCLSKVSKHINYLDKSLNKTKYNKKWNLIVEDDGGMIDELF